MAESEGQILYELTSHWTFAGFKEINNIMAKKITKDLIKSYIAGLFAVLFSIGTSLYIYLKSGRISPVCILCVFVGIAVIVLVRVAFDKKLEDAWKMAPDINGYDETVTFYEDYLIKSNSASTTKLEYSKYERMIDESGYLFLMISDRMANSLLKSECSEELVAFLDRKINSRQSIL